MEAISANQVQANEELKFKVTLSNTGETGAYRWRWEVRVPSIQYDGSSGWGYLASGHSMFKWLAKARIDRMIHREKIRRDDNSTQEWIVDASTGLTDDQLQRQFDRLQRELKKRESRK